MALCWGPSLKAPQIVTILYETTYAGCFSKQGFPFWMVFSENRREARLSGAPTAPKPATWRRLRGGGPSVQAELVAVLGCAAPAPAKAKLAVQAGRLLWLTFLGGAKFAERKDLKDTEEVLHKRHEGKSHLRNTPLIDMEQFPLGWGPSQSTPKPEGQMI